MSEGEWERSVLPLFPLNVVLFPGMELPLHVFESRYQQLVERSLELEGRFALGLIRKGTETGDPPTEAYPTVTLAQITQLARYPDGRMNILVTGKERCRISDLIDAAPYRQARLEAVPESPDPVPPEVLARVTELYRAYIEILLSLSAVPVEQNLPADPGEASYLVARTLQTDLFTKQALLEAPGPHARLVLAIPILEHAVDRLRGFAAIPGEGGYFFYRGKRLSLN